MTLEENQAVERQSLRRVLFVALEENQAVERQSLERFLCVTIYSKVKRSEEKA
jgi:hypothetical protein